MSATFASRWHQALAALGNALRYSLRGLREAKVFAPANSPANTGSALVALLPPEARIQDR